MSHDGIKFASTEQIERDKARQAALSPDAVNPKAVRVRLSDGKGVEIDWKDGHESCYAFGWLRDACPCALCNEKREKDGRAPGEPERAQPGALPMYKAPARPEEVIPTGRYAIAFRWNDGHQHGIYSWEYLRSVCPCDACRATI
ncbi:MAG TPA: DUF971 domain-containing protein [Terriglobales bacterium]